MSDRKPCMDNQRLIVVSETKHDFSLAMQLAFRHCPGDNVWSWWLWSKKSRSDYDKDRPENGLGVADVDKFLVLSWEGGPRQHGSLDAKKTALPVGMNWELAVEFAWQWLQAQDYGRELDHDGSNHKGFIMFNDAWGHVGGDHYAVIAIGPAWAMVGK